MAELREHRVVHELHHAVHDALGMHHHIHAVHGHTEEPARLDHLQALVEQGGGIDGDLAPHLPGRVLECLLQGDVGEFFRGPGAKWPAARGKNQTPDMLVGMAFEALVNGVVLAIDR